LSDRFWPPLTFRRALIIHQGEIERAQPYHEILKKLAPDDPQAKKMDRMLMLLTLSDGLKGLMGRKRSQDS
jgi:hypothetical protein